MYILLLCSDFVPKLSENQDTRESIQSSCWTTTKI